jgi:hypothetical protein
LIVGIHKEFLMKILSRRGLLLFGVLLMVCAFVPSLASAASWSPIGTTHQLFSSNLGVTFTGAATGQAGWVCNASEFDGDVVSANTIEITSGVFTRCHGLFNATNCTVTPRGTNFPWSATATSTTNVQIHGVNVDALFENTPGAPAACPLLGAKVQLTGTVTGGSWIPASNELIYTHDDGLTLHSIVPAGAPVPVALTVTIRDTSGTLRMFD